MKPLPWIALGLVVVQVDTLGGWDLLADPVGWVLVLVGTRALPAPVERRGLLLGLALVSLVAAAVTWPPYVGGRLADADPSLVWAVGLPEVGYAALLAHVLSLAARRAGDRRAAALWSGLRSVTVVVGLLPAVVIGGGQEWLAEPAAALSVLAPLVTIVLLLLHAGRGWATRPPVPAAGVADSPAPGPR